MCHDAHGEEEGVVYDLVGAEASQGEKRGDDSTYCQQYGQEPNSLLHPDDGGRDEVEAEEGVEVPVGSDGGMP